MDADFPRSLRLVLIDEGGCDDDPHDHGGRTAHGIIQREYDGFRARHNLQRQDVWKITPAEYTEIYHDEYWEPWGDRLPAGLDYAFFDTAVNAGPVTAVKTLQRALGVRVDGHMGDVTLGALADISDVEGFITRYCNARRTFYRALAQFPRYGRGWLARVDHVERGAKQIAVTGQEPARQKMADNLAIQATARARSDDVKTPMVSPETGAATTTATAVVAGLTDQLTSAHDQLVPFADTLHVVKYVMLAIAAASICLTIYGVWRRAKSSEAAA